MKKRFLPFLSMMLLLTSCCGGAGGGSETAFRQISADKAKDMMEAHDDAIIVDVREQDEYDDGHIPGAILYPLGLITQRTAKELLPDRDALLLVYCRSGNRSVHAAEKLAELGYTNVYEFGGILDWPYELS